MEVNPISEIVREFSKLDSKKQHEVLEYTRRLGSNSPPKGVAGSTLLRFAGSFDQDELQLIAKAIEEGCEGIDTNEW